MKTDEIFKWLLFMKTEFQIIYNYDCQGPSVGLKVTDYPRNSS